MFEGTKIFTVWNHITQVPYNTGFTVIKKLSMWLSLFEPSGSIRMPAFEFIGLKGMAVALK